MCKESDAAKSKACFRSYFYLIVNSEVDVPSTCLQMDHLRTLNNYCIPLKQMLHVIWKFRNHEKGQKAGSA